MRTQQSRHQPGGRERGSVPIICAFSIDSFRPHANVIQHLHSCSTDVHTVRHFPSARHPRIASYWSVRIPFIQTTAHCASLSVTYPCRFLNYTSQDLQLNCSGIASRISLRRRVPLCLLYDPLRPHQVQRAPLPQLLHQHRVLLCACPEIAAWRHDFGSFIHRLDSEL